MKSTLALAAVAAFALAGCGADEGNNIAAAPANNAGETANAPAAMPETTIAQGLEQAGDKTFRDALQAAGLIPTMAGAGEYTVLAPTDGAFDRLPAGALDGLMKEGAREQLTKVLTYHVLPGTMLVADLGRAVDNGKGKAVLATMNGETLTATREGNALVLTDSAGTKARIEGEEKTYKNGVVHQIDAVLMPS